MTLTYKYAPSSYGGFVRQVEVIDAYITATSADTTDPVNGKPISNDGNVVAIGGQITVSNQAGSSPTANLKLQGSNDGTNWVTIKDSAGNDIATGALDIATASTTTVQGQIDTLQEGRKIFPFKQLRLQVDLGGTTPGWTGSVDMALTRIDNVG